MNQRLVDSVAQTILSMSVDERQLLERKLKKADQLAEASELKPQDKSLRIAKIAQEIRAFEDKYTAPLNESPFSTPVVAETMNTERTASQTAGAPEDDSLYAFFQLVSSLQLEGPEDWSRNVDHYLYGLPKVQDD
ncbi:MAG: hypothetical protein ABG776_00810 [Cyanobacteria bacterium J06555_13]